MKEEKIPAIKNNFYMLKLVWEICPSRIVLTFIMRILGQPGKHTQKHQPDHQKRGEDCPFRLQRGRQIHAYEADYAAV
jgi:hypothetical protein